MGTQKVFFIRIVSRRALTGLADGLAARRRYAATRGGDSPPPMAFGSPVYPCYAGKFSARDRGTVASARRRQPFSSFLQRCLHRSLDFDSMATQKDDLPPGPGPPGPDAAHHVPARPALRGLRRRSARRRRRRDRDAGRLIGGLTLAQLFFSDKLALRGDGRARRSRRRRPRACTR